MKGTILYITNHLPKTERERKRVIIKLANELEKDRASVKKRKNRLFADGKEVFLTNTSTSEKETYQKEIGHRKKSKRKIKTKKEVNESTDSRSPSTYEEHLSKKAERTNSVNTPLYDEPTPNLDNKINIDDAYEVNRLIESSVENISKESGSAPSATDE